MSIFDKYNLFDQDGRKVISVVPIKDRYNVAGVANAIFAAQMWDMSEAELMRFKATHNLYLEQELGTQKTIFDY